jgi:hypothetical protein
MKRLALCALMLGLRWRGGDYKLRAGEDVQWGGRWSRHFVSSKCAFVWFFVWFFVLRTRIAQSHRTAQHNAQRACA